MPWDIFIDHLDCGRLDWPVFQIDIDSECMRFWGCMVSVGCFLLCYDFKEATHTLYAIISIQSISEVFHVLDRLHNWMHFAMASLFVHRDFFVWLQPEDGLPRSDPQVRNYGTCWWWNTTQHYFHREKHIIFRKPVYLQIPGRCQSWISYELGYFSPPSATQPWYVSRRIIFEIVAGLENWLRTLGYGVLYVFR